MSTEFDAPPRLLSQSCSELELAILRSGCEVPSDPSRQARVLAAVGVGTAVALGTKSTWAAVAGWKKLIIGGAIACSGVGGVFAYSVFGGAGPNEASQSASAPVDDAAERSAAERSASERSAAERSASERSAAERSASERSAAERSASERSAAERSASERSAENAGVASRPEPSAGGDFEVLDSEEAVTPTPRGAKRRLTTPRKPSGSGAERSMDTVSGELALLDEAREALRGGNPGGALSHLSGYSRRFPAGKLRLEAEALRIEALAASGKRAEASRRAERLLERHPNSVLAPRLRQFVID